MRLRYRVLDDAGCHTDVRVDLSDGVTVGEVALSVAALIPDANPTGHCGPDTSDGPPTLTIAEADATSTPDPSAPAADAAPCSGSTVRLLPAEDQGTTPPRWSPVELVRRSPQDQGDQDAVRAVRLAYGSTTLGGARILVADSVTVLTTGDIGRVEVDGASVLGGSRVDHGALLRIGSATFTVRIDGPLRAPPGGPWRPHRSVPAVVEHHDPVAVELPAPPGSDRLPGFPLLSATVPLLMGAAMWVATRSAMVAGFAVFSVAFVVASGIEVRREHRRDRRFREQAFLSDLDGAAAGARALRDQQRRRADRDLPTGQEILAWAESPARTWERRPWRPAPLRVAVGTERVEPVDPLKVPDGGRPDLRARLAAVAGELEHVELPALVDLEQSPLGIAGRDDAAAGLARSVVAQLVATLAPEHLALVLDVSADRSASWSWVDWLPHAVRRVATHGGDHPEVGADGLLTVTVVDRGDEVLAGRVPTSSNGGPAPAVVVGDSAASLPDCLGAVVVLDGAHATIRRADGPPTTVRAEGLSVEACEHLARSLTPMHPGPIPGAEHTGTLQDVLADARMLIEDRIVTDAWERSRADRSHLAAPIGHADGGVVRLDLCSDGPHGLVAGTTGSGKSELLRTVVASLALHHPPDRLTFLLVDFKGGAAFRPVAALPHVVGVVSDLAADGAHRAVTSLRAEIRRREHLVSTAGVADLDGLGADAPAALVVVVDELATLADELPDVMDDLLDVAQRGRSLGVHLILATQRPSGVVGDAVRANLSIRLALRVADEDDSRDVVDAPDAAHIPAHRAGRAVLRLGPTERATIQVAGTMHPVLDGPEVRCEVLGAPDRATPPGGASQLDAVVERCRSAAASMASPRRPWVEPLPGHLDPRTLPAPATPGGMVIGLLDRPGEQRHVPAEVDPGRRGGLVVVGAARSGRTGALVSLARAATTDPTRPTTVYGIDAGRDLRSWIGSDGPGGRILDVVAFDDDERVLRLLRGLRARARDDATRPVGRSLPGVDGATRVVLLVDGAAPLIERHERVNRGEAVDLLAAIAADGPSAGVHVAVAVRRLSELPLALVAALDRRLVLRCASIEESDALGVPASAAAVDLPAGRGRLDGEVVQIAAPPGPPVPAPPAGAPAIGRLPRSVRRSDLAPPVGWRIPVGIRGDDLAVASLDLTHRHALLVGPARSGLSSALSTVSWQVCRGTPAGDVVRIGAHDPTGAVEALAELAELARDRRPRTLLVDDLPRLLDAPGAGAVEELLDLVVRLPLDAAVRVVAAADAEALLRCYSDVVRRLRSDRSGILLRPDPDLHPGLLGADLPLHDELDPAPGRGWVVTPEDAVPVQLAR